ASETAAPAGVPPPSASWRTSGLRRSCSLFSIFIRQKSFTYNIQNCARSNCGSVKSGNRYRQRALGPEIDRGFDKGRRTKLRGRGKSPLIQFKPTAPKFWK